MTAQDLTPKFLNTDAATHGLSPASDAGEAVPASSASPATSSSLTRAIPPSARATGAAADLLPVAAPFSIPPHIAAELDRFGVIVRKRTDQNPIKNGPIMDLRPGDEAPF